MQVLGYVLFVILTINYRTCCCQFQLTNHSQLEEHEAIVWNYLGLYEPRDHQSNEFNECHNAVLSLAAYRPGLFQSQAFFLATPTH